MLIGKTGSSSNREKHGKMSEVFLVWKMLMNFEKLLETRRNVLGRSGKIRSGNKYTYQVQKQLFAGIVVLENISTLGKGLIIEYIIVIFGFGLIFEMINQKKAYNCLK